MAPNSLKMRGLRLCKNRDRNQPIPSPPTGNTAMGSTFKGKCGWVKQKSPPSGIPFEGLKIGGDFEDEYLLPTFVNTVLNNSTK